MLFKLWELYVVNMHFIPKIFLILSKLKLATVVEGDPKASFSITTITRCREGCYSFPWIATLYPWSIPLSCWVLSKEASSTIFESASPLLDYLGGEREPHGCQSSINCQQIFMDFPIRRLANERWLKWKQ